MTHVFKTKLFRTASAAGLLTTALIAAVPVQAQVDEIIVTATRRAESIQDIPFNIAAVGAEQIEQQGFDDLSELVAFVPGINIVDQGGRDGNRIVVRGLNAEAISGGGGGAGSDGGGTVSTYLGEIPNFVDLRLNDLERVEVLLGPQGTLYGAGTLGGAIRYIPNKPSFDGPSAELRSEAFVIDEGDGISYDIGFTGNYAFNDSIAIRGSIDYLDNKGFIDYPFVNRGIAETFDSDGFADLSNNGTNAVSTLPDPDFSDPDAVAANLIGFEDVNTEQVLSGRAAIRFQPNDRFDANLTYYYQNAENGGRTTSGARGELETGLYEAPLRVLEPSELESQLLALEVVADLGFAELTSATGIAEETFIGQRDQTDLLISLEYSYETVPTFTAFTLEQEESSIINQELRLVSKNEGPFNWIIGGFYNEREGEGLSEEFVPGFGGPDFRQGLEFYSFGANKLEERAVFGEVEYDITPNWTVGFGARLYDYDLDTADSPDLDFPNQNPGQVEVFFPLFEDCGPDSLTPENIPCGLSFSDAQDTFELGDNQDFSGELFKINTSYRFGNGNSAYATFSQGFRVGLSNGLAPCDDIFDPNMPQGQCGLVPGQQFGPNDDDIAQLNEREATPDEVDNYEIGVKTTWLDGDLRLNLAAFYIDWTDIQLVSSSINAGLPITVNGGTARSRGVEFDGSWQINDRLNLRGNYSYTDAELTQDVPDLVRAIVPGGGFDDDLQAGLDGQRLPGSPEHQFSVFLDYTKPLSTGADFNFNTGYSWQGNVLSRVGGLGDSLELPDYGRLNTQIGYEEDAWQIYAFVDNVFNTLSESSVVATEQFNQTISGAAVRSFRTNILPPRTIGARLRYKFGQ